MVGTTRSRVNHFMNKFRKLGFIDYRDSGGLTVHSGLLSVVLHDDAERPLCSSFPSPGLQPRSLPIASMTMQG